MSRNNVRDSKRHSIPCRGNPALCSLRTAPSTPHLYLHKRGRSLRVSLSKSLHVQKSAAELTSMARVPSVYNVPGGNGEFDKGEDMADDEAHDEGWRIRAQDFILPQEQQLSTTAYCRQLSASSWLPPVCKGNQARVQHYYNCQKEIVKEMHGLDGLLEMNADALVNEQTALELQAASRKVKLAIRVSNYANIILFSVKIYISVRTVSLAIIASTLDSLLDLLSGFILWYTSHKMSKPNPYLYPIGKSRMQPVGILVFASIMATLGMQIFIEGTKQLISKDSHLALEGSKEFWVIGTMVSVTVVKLLLTIFCRQFKNEIVLAYAKDHLFDVVTNSIGLIAAILASKFYWWIDPAGAILLALYTILNWSNTVIENVSSLVGQTAPPEFLQKITYLCWNHHKSIQQIDTIKAYKFGDLYFSEVDIVLPASMPLQDAHDIGESLQNKLESLPEIERAYVHLDYEYSHKPEHAQKTVYQAGSM